MFASPAGVIDVGELRRLFAGATRRAVELAAQGRECFHPTCDTPAEACQIDHVVALDTPAGTPFRRMAGRRAAFTIATGIDEPDVRRSSGTNEVGTANISRSKLIQPCPCDARPWVRHWRHGTRADSHSR